jgi:hypothetical protein
MAVETVTSRQLSGSSVDARLTGRISAISMDVRVLPRFVNGQSAEFTEETQAVAAAFWEDQAEDAENARRVDPFRSARAQRTHDPGHERYSLTPFGLADRNLLVAPNYTRRFRPASGKTRG